MIRLLVFVLLSCGVALQSFGQSNKLIKELEGKRGDLQKRIAESETLLQTTKQDVGSQLAGLSTLNGQIEERKRYILQVNNDMEAIDRELASLDREVERLERDLQDKKEKYAASVRYLYKNRSVEDKLMFILSADNLAQIYRRLRYVREYADFQRLQGEDIKRRQEQIGRKQNELLEVRQAKEALLKERESEKQKLEKEEKEKKGLLNKLRRKQRGLQNELAKQRKEAARLNARIDKLIAEEIEKARKRAEEEARRESAARKRGEGTAAPANADAGKAGQPVTAAPLEAYTMDKADRQLSGTFASNRGKLPIPITGPYLIVSRYGQYPVKELKGVVLDNKGIDIQGQPGAQARAVFGGKVAAVFKLDGLFNILVRHGAYISVYCNLASTAVKAGDEVSINQPLGTVFSNPADGGRTVLHFQLRKEKEKLNPELWIDR